MAQNVVPALCGLLAARDKRTAKVALEGIENLLRHEAREAAMLPNPDAPGQRKNACVLAIEACGGIEKIEKLQEADDHSTYELAVRVLQEHFNAEEGEGEGERVG